MARAEIRARATLDNKGFQTGITQMQQGVQRFAGGQLKAVSGAVAAAFTVQAVASFTKNMLNAADAVDNTSKQLGVGAENLQTLQRQAELTTGSAEGMTSALHRIQKTMAEAVAGDKTAIDAFKQLGITYEDVTNLSPDKIFEKIAIATSKAGPASKEAAAAGDLMGRSYTELKSVIDSVANEGLENLKNQMLETNQIMSDDMVKSADELEEKWNKFTTGLVNGLRKAVLALVDFGGRVKDVFTGETGAEFGGSMQDWMAQYKEPTGQTDFAAKQTAKKVRAQKAFDATEGVTVSAPQAADSLARIGGVIGGQSNPMRQVAERQLKIQENMEKHLQKMKDAMEQVADHTSVLEE